MSTAGGATPPKAASRTRRVVSVAIADDHPAVVHALTSVLEADPGFRVVGAASTGEEAIALVERAEPDVLVADVRMPGLDGIEVTAHLKTTHPEVAVVIFTRHDQESTLLRALDAGANGFVTKRSELAMVRQAVREAAEGRTFLDPVIASAAVHFATQGRRAKGPHGLTVQEMRVLEMLPKGLTNPDIARELGVSRETVKTHVCHILCKLQVSDRAEAAAVAVREGFA